MYTMKVLLWTKTFNKQNELNGFKSRDPVRSQIVTRNNIIEKINIFNYPGCSTAYQNQKDVTVKISKCSQITGIIKRSLKSSQVKNQT
jgi:hypothetical protein